MRDADDSGESALLHRTTGQNARCGLRFLETAQRGCCATCCRQGGFMVRKWSALLATGLFVILAGCEEGSSEGGDVQSTVEFDAEYDCCINGAYFECESSDAVAACASGDTSGCSSAGDC
jgi:hypothetical protein